MKTAMIFSIDLFPIRETSLIEESSFAVLKNLLGFLIFNLIYITGERCRLYELLFDSFPIE